jgi:hypothetical protein
VNHLDERKYEPDEELPSGSTPNKKMERKRGQHGARVMLGNPALGRHRRNDPETDSYRDRAVMMDRVKDSLDKGEDPRDDEGRKNLIKAARRPRASYERQDDRPGGLRANRTKAGGYRTLVRKESFDIIAEYLFVEGFAETIESAELIAESISAEWVNEIIEGYVELTAKKKDAMTNRANKLLNKDDWDNANKIEKARTHDPEASKAKAEANKKRR